MRFFITVIAILSFLAIALQVMHAHNEASKMNCIAMFQWEGSEACGFIMWQFPK
jgi:hypothetical protein